MEFPDAIAKLEEAFGPMAEPLGFEPDEVAYIGSGGMLSKAIDESPVLCRDRAVAIKLWFDTAMAEMRDKFFTESDMSGERKPLRWRITDGPHCDKWRITIQDERCTHRIAADRYSVICTIGLAGAASDPEAQPDKD